MVHQLQHVLLAVDKDVEPVTSGGVHTFRRLPSGHIMKDHGQRGAIEICLEKKNAKISVLEFLLKKKKDDGNESNTNAQFRARSTKNNSS